ncbi:MAG: DUF1073 domain-containing protein, partial [Gammaproteobacteria bacterium]|nr:DUF1073 domain-containing protein [Gammaproteobacteria bacterium]
VATTREFARREIAASAALALNVLSSRLDLAHALGQTAYGGQRDYNKTLGYPTSLNIANYLARYERQDIAGRVVDLPAQDTWKKEFSLKDGDRDDTDFVNAWLSLESALHTRSMLSRADKIGGIGRYGVLYVGYRDAREPDQPVDPGAIDGVDDVLFLRPFSEQGATIKELVKDTQDKRFGLPELYELSIDGGGKLRVHHTRVLHLADGKLDSEVYGTPRLQRVYNRLDDLIKIVGGSAEATWLNMRPGTVLTTQSGYSFGEDDDSKLQIQHEIEEYLHDLSRIMTLEGVDVKQLTGQIMDPENPFDVTLALIAAASGIPQRVLLGSAAGELAAAEEDTKQWYGVIESRQQNYAEPEILRPFVDSLIANNALPAPASGAYDVYWPPLFQMSAREIAEITKTRAEAVKSLANPLTMELPLSTEQILDLLGYESESEPASSIVAQLVRSNRARGLSNDRYRAWLEAELEEVST